MDGLKLHQEFELAKLVCCIEGETLSMPRRIAKAKCSETSRRLQNLVSELGNAEFWMQFEEGETVTATEALETLDLVAHSQDLLDNEILVILHQSLKVLYCFENYLEAHVPP